MKRYLLITLLSVAMTHTEPTWQTYIDRYNQNYDLLKEEIKEKILGNFVNAGFDPTQQGEVRMFIEIIHRRMNRNEKESLNKESLAAMVKAFYDNTPDKYDLAEEICADMTITSSELRRAKRILNKTHFSTAIEEIYSDLMLAIPECKIIPFNEPDKLNNDVAEGRVTEDCIVRCMHARVLVLSLAACLITTHNKA